MPADAPFETLHAMAQLIVRFGANVQPGQVVAISSEPGKEPLARAVAEAAYRAGATFVDLSVFDIHLKRLRALHAAPDTLDYVPPWYGERVRRLGELRGATIALSGPVAPDIMRDVDPQLLGRDILPRVRESIEVLNQRTVNWTVAPCPTSGWARAIFPELDDERALARLWQEVAHACRVDELDPVASWKTRLDRLAAVATKLDDMQLDTLRFDGPGTQLTVGLLASSRWQAARLATVEGVVHAPNIPTEEVFTTPDPERVDGFVTSTKPLFVAGAMIRGLRMGFARGRAVEIDADQGGQAVRTLAERDDGASRLGEVALVDGESRIGNLGTVFFDTLLDENAASHIALGQGFEFAVGDEAERERVNRSELHVDVMVGASSVAVTGVMADGTEIPLLRDGVWQI